MPAALHTGLLLGAGASYELGMPLGCHLTDEIKGYFTAECIRRLNQGWKQQGFGYDEEIVNYWISIIQRQDMSYEDMLGHFQTLYLRHSPVAAQYHKIYGKMLELVYAVLYFRQVNNDVYIRAGLAPFEGLAYLAHANKPLWIFSLNHDLMLDLIAQHCGIAMRDGFWSDKTLNLSTKDKNGHLLKLLEADILSEQDLGTGRFNFFPAGEAGINLFKLHGALDVFAFREGLDLCRLRPQGNDLAGRLRALRILNEAFLYYEGKPGGIINEIVYADEYGEVQFLRRSLLAGAYKFDQRFAQTLPQKLLPYFASNLNYLQCLCTIGYGFGDSHINEPIRKWLEFFHERRLIIVDPQRLNIPRNFTHLAPQIEIVRRSASEFFSSYRSEPLTASQRLIMHIRNTRRPAVEKRAAQKWG